MMCEWEGARWLDRNRRLGGWIRDSGEGIDDSCSKALPVWPVFWGTKWPFTLLVSR